MNRALLVVALILAAAAAIIPWRTGDAAAGIDFFQFWAGAELQPEVDNLYAAETRQAKYNPFVEAAFARDPSHKLLTAARLRPEFDFFSTPFLYATFRLLPDGYDRALLVYRVASLLSLIAGVLLLARSARLSWTASLLLLAFSLALFQAVKSEVRVVNVNFIQLFLIGLGAWLARSNEKGRAIAAGFVLAAATMWKPNIALVLPLLLLYRRRVWELAGAAAGVVAALLLSLPFDNWLEWLAHVRGLAEVRSLALGNVAPVLTLVDRFGAGAAFVVMAVLLALAVAAVIRGKRGDDAVPLLIGVALLIYLLSSTLVWLHYLVLALPAGIALVREKPWPAAVALTFAGVDLWLWTGIGYHKLLWLGLAALYAMSLWRLAQRDVR